MDNWEILRDAFWLTMIIYRVNMHQYVGPEHVKKMVEGGS